MSLPYEFNVEKIISEERVSRKDIEEVKEWLKTTLLPPIQDEMIALFLLSCLNNVVDVQSDIIGYFKIKSQGPQIFMGRDIDDPVLTKAMEVIICCSIPTRMDNNTAVHLFRLNDTNYKKFDMVTNSKLTFMLVDVTQRYDPPNDTVVVIDMEGSTFMHLTCVKLDAAKIFLDFMQESMPIKVKKIHILNANAVFQKALAIAKMFMHGDIMKLIIPHSPKMTMEEFHRECVPPSCLPVEYGGELPSYKELNRMTIQQFVEMKEFYRIEEEMIESYKLMNTKKTSKSKK